MNDGLQPGESLRVSFYDNKYAVIQLKSGEMRYLRYGEPWKAADSDFQHVGILLAAAQEIQKLRECIDELLKDHKEFMQEVPK